MHKRGEISQISGVLCIADNRFRNPRVSPAWKAVPRSTDGYRCRTWLRNDRELRDMTRARPAQVGRIGVDARCRIETVRHVPAVVVAMKLERVLSERSGDLDWRMRLRRSLTKTTRRCRLVATGATTGTTGRKRPVRRTRSVREG